MKKIAALLVLTLCTACTGNFHNDYRYYLAQKQILVAHDKEAPFTQCHGYGCKFKTPTTLSKKEWSAITKAFTPKAKTPEIEREHIKKAIAKFETIVGEKNGTNKDTYGTFIELGDKQLDCVDESTNTTTYLAMLEEQGFLKFHALRPPAVRLPIIHAGRWPHQTATIEETASQTRYVVDSWFHDNGFAPEIVTLDEWKQGWKPEQHHQQQKQPQP